MLSVRHVSGHYNSIEFGTDLTQDKYPVAALGSILGMVQYGTSEKANSHGEGVPVLRINNIKNCALELTDLKYVSLPAPAKRGLEHVLKVKLM